MNDPIYGAERSIAFYASTEREHQAVLPTEATLTVWAIIALIFVLAALTLGGCS